MIYLQNRVLFSHKKEWSVRTHYNMDEPWRYHTKWKKPVSHKRPYTVWLHLYEMSKMGKSIVMKSGLMVANVGGLGENDC